MQQPFVGAVFKVQLRSHSQGRQAGEVETCSPKSAENSLSESNGQPSCRYKYSLQLSFVPTLCSTLNRSAGHGYCERLRKEYRSSCPISIQVCSSKYSVNVSSHICNIGLIICTMLSYRSIKTPFVVNSEKTLGKVGKQVFVLK